MAFTHQQFFVGGIAFDPGFESVGFVSRFTDYNDTETGQNIRFDGTRILLTADADQLWQIGIDVAEKHRSQGLAAAMTVALASEAAANDAVAYYGTTASNIPSMRAALSAGFRPGWVDAFTIRRSMVHSETLSPRR